MKIFSSLVISIFILVPGDNTYESIVFSCDFNTHSCTWWSKSDNTYEPAVTFMTQLINETNHKVLSSFILTYLSVTKLILCLVGSKLIVTITSHEHINKTIRHLNTCAIDEFPSNTNFQFLN